MHGNLPAHLPPTPRCPARPRPRPPRYGRALLRIAFTGEIETDDALGQPLRLTWHDVKGPVAGFLLWDPGRGLVAYQEYEGHLEGTVTPPNRPFHRDEPGGRRANPAGAVRPTACVTGGEARSPRTPRP